MPTENNISTAVPSGGIAQPSTWWNLFALGPYTSSPDIALSNLPFETPAVKEIQAGQPAYIVAAMYLNPNPVLPPEPGISPCTFLSNFSLDYEISFEPETETPVGTLPNAKQVKSGNLIPGECFYVNILEIVIQVPSQVAVKINARLLGVMRSEQDETMFTGTASWVPTLTQEMLDNAFMEGERQPILDVKFAIVPPAAT